MSALAIFCTIVTGALAAAFLAILTKAVSTKKANSQLTVLAPAADADARIYDLNTELENIRETFLTVAR